MITDEDVEKAVDYLRDNAKAAGKAKAERIYMTEYRKVVKAQLMRETPMESAAIQERNAYSHSSYVHHLQVMRDAVEKDEYYTWMKVASEAKIEAWRTQNANARAEGKAYSR